MSNTLNQHERSTAPEAGVGVYFLSNDNMYDLTVAFLNSFRHHNPDLPLCLIPFNDNIEKISRLKDTYDFFVYDNATLLTRCDEISTQFHDRVLGAYRKLAAWEGPFERFVYIDVDTVLVSNIEFVFPWLERYDCLTSHSCIPEIRKFVWKDSIYQTPALSDMQIAFAANTGFIASKKEFLPFEVVLRDLDKALALKEDMELFCMEQPFLNYYIVTRGKMYSSFHVLCSQGHRGLKLEAWGGLTGGVIDRGKIKFPQQAETFLVHWAGIWRPNRWDNIYNSIIGKLKIDRFIKRRVINSRMPYKKLWSYYRNHHLERARQR